MRVTRARAQQGNDETIDATERAPLNEISPNASPEQLRPQVELPVKTPVKTPAKTAAKKAKGKGRAKKGKKGKAVEEEHIEAAAGDEEASIEPPASGAAVDDATNASSHDVAQVPTNDEPPATPPPKAVRLTRRQLAKQEEEMKQSQRPASPPREQELATEEVLQIRDEDMAADIPEEDADAGALESEAENIQPTATSRDEDHVDGAQNVPLAEPETPQKMVESQELEKSISVVEPEEAPPSQTQDPKAQIEPLEPEAITPSFEITSEPEPKTLVAEKPSEDVMTPLKSHPTSRRASRSPSKSPMRLEESFEAIDALEEALENVTSVTSFNHARDEKSPKREDFTKTTATPNTRSKTSKKATLEAAKISRTPSAVAPKSMKPIKSSMARASSVRVAPNKDIKKGSTETVDYLASKRRPVSVSFPTPPPPPKGRAPTKPTFQLSSNDVVAKLKAQKEERLKREAEGGIPKQRPTSMPPPPRSTKPLTKPTFQLPGEKVAEKLKAQKEERLKKEADVPERSAPAQRPVSISMAPLAKSTKAPTKASFELPGAVVAEKLRMQKEERLKRMDEAEAAKKEAALKARHQAPVRKPLTVPIRHQPGITIPPPQPQNQRASSLATKRSSIALSVSQPLSQSRSTSTSSANRNSALLVKAVVTPVDAAQQKLKGREVFNRDRMEKEARERERKEKEEAAKKARAEAAERGRIASREWAEKQRRKLMGV
ncbi:hypothetical protein BDW02DRAFT_638967 [Decorospora gaudefroyi]|uniref:Uncharacterized protein n=1 Tax=Decorospora gaudefroyi TaxID=184978 RepID=A0A6A5KFI6_9PLEO|nr:hypothetical protein BDW02DRAFT_638967 [Decorospora gaudefroyi]